MCLSVNQCSSLGFEFTSSYLILDYDLFKLKIPGEHLNIFEQHLTTAFNMFLTDDTMIISQGTLIYLSRTPIEVFVGDFQSILSFSGHIPLDFT